MASVARAGALCLAAGVVAVSCYAPDEELDRFNFRCTRTTDSICVPKAPTGGGMGSPDGGPCSCPQSDVDKIPGKFFIAISSGIPGIETFPTMQQVEIIDAEALDDGRTRIHMRSRPVVACDPTQAIPGEDFSEPREFFIEEDCSLVLDLPEQTIPGEGNGVTGGLIRSKATLTTRVCTESQNFQCGTTAGELFEPVTGSLENGSWAQVRVDEHGEVPDPVVLDCMGTLAAIDMFPACMSM